MKVLILSTSDIIGGAARATYRLLQGLQEIDVNSQMLVQVKNSNNLNVVGSDASSGKAQVRTGLSLIVDNFPLKLYSNYCGSSYSLQWLPDKIVSEVSSIAPDIINVHWIGNGYVKVETLARLNRPIVWTLHDMWAFTGGCHYNQNCDRYTASCGACPQLGSKKDWDLSRWVWQRKAKSWKNFDFTVVTPSSWLAKCARQSSLFKDRRVEVIPYGLDLNTYQPINKRVARKLLKLPEDKQLILFLSLGATSDKRKGFNLLQPALQELSRADWREKLEIMIVGASRPKNPPEFGFKSYYLDTLNDDLTLALAYSAADVFIAPSIQDNLPNTVLEAIACGIPCVAFDIGGMPDAIEHQQNGYLAEPYQIDDLVRGIIWTLENEARYQKLSCRAREKAEQEFALEIQARRYESLFDDIFKEKKLSKLTKTNCKT